MYPAGRKRRPLPPERGFQHGPQHRYRLQHTKLGRIRFTSHLDLVRQLPRAFRRAGLELSYSRGFHPQPLFSYGPPLRLGLASIGEQFECRLDERVPVDDLIERVNAELPEGLLLRSGEPVGAGMPKLSKLTAWADYLVFLPAELADRVAAADLERLRGGGPLWVERTSKKSRTREIDIAAGVGTVEWLPELPVDAAGLLELHPDDRLLGLQLGLAEELVRPEEALLFLFDGCVPASARIVRRRLLPRPVTAPAAT